MTSSTYLAAALTIGLTLSAVALGMSLATRAANAQNVGSGANGEAPTMRVYAAKAVTDYDAQILRARTIAGAL